MGCYSCLMQLIGVILITLVTVMLVVHVYGFFAVIALVLKKRLGVFFGLTWIAIGASLLYNIVFNYFWACMIRPGGPKDLMLNEKIRLEVKNRENRKAAKVAINSDGSTSNVEVEDDRFEGLQKDVKRLMRYRTKTMANLRGFWNRKCTLCNEIKPARTHHCSVCNTCVFQMSHHCPFTNNCVGLENQRFFLLFIFYSMLGTIYYMFSIISIWGNHVYKENHKLMSFLFVFDVLCTVGLFAFNMWNWIIAGTGLTTVEFVTRHTGQNANYYDFSFQRVRDNMFKVFGTKSYF